MTTTWPQSHRGTEVNALTQNIIGCAIEIHRVLGPGLLEAIYESAICLELDEQHIKYERQRKLPVTYKGRILGQYRIDLIVENLVIVEVKAVEKTPLLFEAQLLTYLRLTGMRVGLILNFNSHLLKDGIRRMIL
jgi:GxxExxY protein